MKLSPYKRLFEKLLKRDIINKVIIEIYINPNSLSKFSSTVRGIIDENGNLIIWDKITFLHIDMLKYLIENNYIKSSHFKYNMGWLDNIIKDDILPVQRIIGTDTFGVSESIHDNYIENNLQKINKILLKALKKNPKIKFTPNRVI